MSQLDNLDALIRTAMRARMDARNGNLFVSRAGFALINALHDLTEIKEVYDLAGDVAMQAGIDAEPSIGALYRSAVA